jgi:hypothetical protein
MTNEECEARFLHLRERVADRGFKVRSWCCGNPPVVIITIADPKRNISFVFERAYETFCGPEDMGPRCELISAWFRHVIRRIDQIDLAEEISEGRRR